MSDWGGTPNYFSEVVCQEPVSDDRWTPLNRELICPPGFQPLLPASKLILKLRDRVQHPGVTGALMSKPLKFNSGSCSVIKNENKEIIYFAAEESEYCDRFCCGVYRSFEMIVADVHGNEIIHTTRPLVCDGCCSCRQVIQVYAPRNTLIGSVEKVKGCWSRTFEVKDAADQVVLKLAVPFCVHKRSFPTFKIFSKDGEIELGKIKRKWAGAFAEFCTLNDKFEITFPVDLDVKIKGVLIGGLFLLDKMYFSK